MNLNFSVLVLVLVVRAVCFDFDSYQITWDLPPVPTDAPTTSASVTLTSAMHNTTVTSNYSQSVSQPPTTADVTDVPVLTTTLTTTTSVPVTFTTARPMTVTSTVASTTQRNLATVTLPIPVPNKPTAVNVLPLEKFEFEKTEVKSSLADDLDLAYDLESQIPAVANVSDPVFVNTTLEELEKTVYDLEENVKNLTSTQTNSTTLESGNIWDQFSALLSTSDGRAFFVTIIAAG